MKAPLRRHGNAPFRVVVVHGGPGAPGHMAPVARELALERGVIEPLQTGRSLAEQVEELRATLVANAQQPITLIGSSWGAMLAFLVAAHDPQLVAKLILVGSAVFAERYARNILPTRLARMSESERTSTEQLLIELTHPATPNKDALFARLGALMTRIDSYDPMTLDTEVLEHQFEIFDRVWHDAQALRKSGKLLELGRRICCPVLAIHGDYDPHPVEGVRVPLSVLLGDFRCIVLDRCGHFPWIERHARDPFFALLRREIVG